LEHAKKPAKSEYAKASKFISNLFFVVVCARVRLTLFEVCAKEKFAVGVMKKLLCK